MIEHNPVQAGKTHFLAGSRTEVYENRNETARKSVSMGELLRRDRIPDNQNPDFAHRMSPGLIKIPLCLLGLGLN